MPAAVFDHGGNTHAQIQTDRESQCVESRPEVGDRRGDGNLARPIHALHSPSITSGLKA
jgi:hypothetical protein